MSKISNSNVLVGSGADAAPTNTKFSDVATATGDIDANNVAYQGIDSGQLKDNYLVVRRGYVDNGVTDATAAIAYPALKAGGANSGVQSVDHVGSTTSSTGLLIDLSSNPLVLKDGDILRIWHSCHLYKHEHGNMITGYSSGPPAAYVVSQSSMVTFPGIAWGTGGASFGKTGGSLHGWEAFPGWDQNWMNSTDSGQEVKFISGPSDTTYRSYGLAKYPLHGAKISSTEMRTRYTGGSALNYVHSGSEVYVWGLRVFMYGPVAYNPLTPASLGYSSFSMVSSTTAFGALVDNFHISMGHIGFMQMRGGTV